MSAFGAHLRPEKPFLPNWLMLDAEYRVRSLHIDPLEIGSEGVREVSWSEQRLRLNLGLKVPKRISVHVQMDALDGVLLGDNGQFGSQPTPTSGLALASRRPNLAGWKVGFATPDGDPFSTGSYGPVLTSLSPLEVNWAFARVHLPVGMLQVGRQPFALGAGMAGHDGSRRNRFGVSHFSHSADRVLFGTKIDQWVKRFSQGAAYKPDTSQDNGVFLVGAYDWTVQDQITSTNDDLHQVLGGVIWRVRQANWLGLDWRNLVALSMVLYKFSDEFHTNVLAFPFRLKGDVGPTSWDFEYTLVTGTTREIAEGYSILSGDEARDQKILAMGAHASVGVTLGPVELWAQFNYASGDDDPRTSTSWQGFSYARDFNMGLLMFEHIMAYESARSAAVGIHTLASEDAAAFPITEVASEGRFSNALALFPQVTWHILASQSHKLHLRFGALFAWAAAKGGVVDPVATIRQFDGEKIDDDRVNFHGGKSGGYYGTEFDAQLSWTWANHFAWTMEAAFLLPGSGMENSHGKATKPFLFENRFEVMF